MQSIHDYLMTTEMVKDSYYGKDFLNRRNGLQAYTVNGGPVLYLFPVGGKNGCPTCGTGQVPAKTMAVLADATFGAASLPRFVDPGTRSAAWRPIPLEDLRACGAL